MHLTTTPNVYEQLCQPSSRRHILLRISRLSNNTGIENREDKESPRQSHSLTILKVHKIRPGLEKFELTLKHWLNVPSRRRSGRQVFRASQALQNKEQRVLQHNFLHVKSVGSDVSTMHKWRKTSLLGPLYINKRCFARSARKWPTQVIDLSIKIERCTEDYRRGGDSNGWCASAVGRKDFRQVSEPCFPARRPRQRTSLRSHICTQAQHRPEESSEQWRSPPETPEIRWGIWRDVPSFSTFISQAKRWLSK